MIKLQEGDYKAEGDKIKSLKSLDEILAAHQGGKG